MTRQNWTTLALLVTISAGAVGCDNKTKEENALLTEENQSLRAQLQDRNEALDASNMELRDRNRELADLRRQLSDPAAVPASTTGFDNIPGVTSSYANGIVTASVASDVLFASGSTTLKSAAKQSLNSVAQVLNSTYSGQPIRIAGHTDTDPIRKSGFKTNYHLGFERAFAVREYLASRGVSRDMMYIASYGPDQPVGSKDQSRRVEIMVETG